MPGEEAEEAAAAQMRQKLEVRKQVVEGTEGQVAEAAADGEAKDDDEEDEDVPEVPEAPAAGPSHEPFSFKLFMTVKNQQSLNGLRHNDHLRYRQYCARRLRRLRVALKFKNGKTRFKQPTFPADFADPRFLQIPAVHAERAWSYGVQLKADNATASVFNPRWRHHSIRRFAKAARWAEFLESVCKIHGDHRTQREAEAYTAFHVGNYLLEMENWEEALQKLMRCRRVCEHLALASEQAEGSIFKTMAQELAPAIRECKYNLGMGFDADEPDDAAGEAKTAASGGATKEANKELSSDLSYREQALAIPSDRIKGKLFKCLQLVNTLKVEDGPDGEAAAMIEKYGEVSAECTDVLQDIHTDMIAGAGRDGGEGPSEDEWRVLEAFARELLLCMNVERNLVLLWRRLLTVDGVEEFTSVEARRDIRPEEGMRICDILKEDIQNLCDLPRTSDSISGILHSYLAIVLNCRCFFLAFCHTLMGRSLEAAALFDMLRSRLEEQPLSDALADPLGRLHPLVNRIYQSLPLRVSQWRCRGLALLCATEAMKDKTQAESEAAQVTLEDFKALANSFPPKVRDITCKPLLFDLAFPCITEPDIEELAPQKDEGQGQEKGPGILGRVAGGLGSRLGGLWGRK